MAVKPAAVIFDWAGTTVDHGSLAPVRTLQRVFAEFGMNITEAQARRDMGIAKRDHIARLLAPNDEQVDQIYQRFIPVQAACLAEYSTVIDGVPEAVAKLRARGLKIASNTGYTRDMLAIILEIARAAGYDPDVSLTPEDVGAGRPFPFMIYEAAIRLKVYPLSAIIKVGDTVADIEEALNAGCVAVGVAQTGNLIGLSAADFAALPAAEKETRLIAAREKLTAAGAHYVVNTLAELNAVVSELF